MKLATLPSRRGRPGLLPMIDVVFLLLIFFILSARFGAETGVEIDLLGTGDAKGDVPRLIDIGPDTLRLNGRPLTLSEMPNAVRGLMVGDTSQIVVLRPGNGVRLQRVVEVMDTLRGDGVTTLAIVEP